MNGTRRRLGIYGGSFYPPHGGHLRAALAFYDELKLDRLLIMPAGIPPHKRLESCFTAEARLELCRVCFQGDAIGHRNIEVCDYEIRKDGPSYTADTLAAFSSERQELFFLCGSDMFLTLDRWYRPDRIFAFGTPVLARREEDRATGDALLEKRAAYKTIYGKEAIFLSLPAFPISSSEIRARYQQGDDVSAYVTEPVLKKMRDWGLFSEESAVEALRHQIVRLEDERRAAHSMAVEDECVYLAKQFSLSDTERSKLRFAALLHDLTHRYTAEQHEALLREGGLGENEIRALLKEKNTVHQTSGAFLAAKRFPYLADETVCEAIACHTTGKPQMPLLPSLLCLADYIEATRPYEGCRSLRRRFHAALESVKDGAESRARKEELLLRALSEYYRETLAHLAACGVTPDPKTALAAASLPENLPPLP